MASKAVENVLSPGIDVRVEGVCDSSGILVVEAVPTARPGPVPELSQAGPSRAQHHQHTLGKRPSGSRRVIVRLRVRRYIRDRKSCSRTTFTEQMPDLSTRYRRPVPGLRTGCSRSRSTSAAVPPHGCTADRG
ncbi:hypothetical protein [Streptomyces sp. NPDC001056]